MPPPHDFNLIRDWHDDAAWEALVATFSPADQGFVRNEAATWGLSIRRTMLRFIRQVMAQRARQRRHAAQPATRRQRRGTRATRPHRGGPRR